ncbi:MAG TPA: oligosaccharide flippase family protein [Sphingomicrobium sp.]|nr:oligosaccharide flippase family protein [Sphingomicrobium sp.]
MAGMASTFGLGVMLARLLGPADYGTYGLVVALAALAMTFAHLGTYQLAVRELSVRSSRGDLAGARRMAVQFLTVAGGASVLLGAASVLIALAIFGPGSRELAYAWLGALLVMFLTVSTLMAAELRGLGALVKGQFFEFLGRPAIALAGVVVLLVIGVRLGAIGALWLQVGAAAIALLVSSVWLARALPKACGDRPTKRDFSWLKAALPLGAVELLRQLDGTYAIVLVAAFSSADDVGIFRVAVACTPLLGMPGAMMHMVLAPRIARLHAAGDRNELQRLLAETSALLVAILLPVTILVALFGRPLVGAVFGPAYVDAAAPLIVFTIAHTVFGFFGMGPVLLAMTDSERHLTKIYLGAVGLAVAASLPLIILLGTIGAALAQVVSFAVVGLFSWRYAKRAFGLEMTFLKRRQAAEKSS